MRGTLTALLFAFVMSDAMAQDAPSHDVRVAIDPSERRIEIEDTVTLTGSGPKRFTLMEAMTLSRLSLDGRNLPIPSDVTRIEIDLGGDGPHTIAYEATAILDAPMPPYRPPFLGADGGFLGYLWLLDSSGPEHYRIELEIADGHKAILSGRLAEETQDNDRYKATFHSEGPGNPPLLLSGPFDVTQVMAGTVPIRTYFHPELKDMTETYLSASKTYLKAYADDIGPYPYAGFAIVSSPAPVGLSFPGMTMMGRRVLHLPFIPKTSLPHEVLHSWWGNGVGVDYESGNWAEGLTTYMADHAMRPDGGKAKRLEWLRNYAALPDSQDFALTDFRARGHDASQVVGYGKTALVFHMLKTEFGEDNFRAAIARFYGDNKGKRASWADIQSAFEAETGESLSAFFKAWVDRPGAPKLSLSDAQADANRIRFTLTQETEHPYPLHIPVEVETVDGLEAFAVSLTKTDETFTFEATGTVKALHIDPNFDVFRRLSVSQAPPILRDVTLHPGTRAIIAGRGEFSMPGLEAFSILTGNPPSMSDEGNPPKDRPLIVFGPPDKITPVLERLKIERPDLPRPEIEPEADADLSRIWTARTDTGQAVLIWETAKPDWIVPLATAVRHHRRQSWLVGLDGLVVDRDVWESGPSPLTGRFD